MTMILVWPRTRHICCMEEMGFAEWSVASEDDYRRRSTRRTGDMGLDLVQAAAMGYLQCDLELEFMVMMDNSELKSGIFLNVSARPKVMGAIVTVQLRWRYKKMRARLGCGAA